MCCLQGCVWHSSSANSPSTKMWKRRTKTDGKIWDWNVTSEEHGGVYLCDKLVRTVSLSQCTHTPGVRVASGQRSSQNEQLHLLACSCVPRPVEATLHPSAFAPHRMPAAGGPVADPSRWCVLGVDGSHSTGSWPRCVGTLPPGETPIWCGGDDAHDHLGSGRVRGPKLGGLCYCVCASTHVLTRTQ